MKGIVGMQMIESKDGIEDSFTLKRDFLGVKLEKQSALKIDTIT